MRAYRPELEQSTAVGLDAVLDEPERCEIVYGHSSLSVASSSAVL